MSAGVGHAAMAALPAILTLLSGLTGDKGKHGSTYSKNQRGLIDEAINSIRGMQGNQDVTQNQNYQTGQDYLQSMFNDPEFFNRFEAPLQRQFQEQTVPELANRFAGMGSGGSTGSTGFRNQLAREGGNLSTNIAALRGGMQQGAVPQLLGYAQQPFSNLMSMYQNALTPTQNTYQGPSPGFGGNTSAAMFGGLSNIYGQQWGQSAASGQNQSQGGFQAPQSMQRGYPGQYHSTY